MIALNRQMPVPARDEEHDGVGALKRVRRFRPTVLVDDYFDIRISGETFLEEQTTRIVLMLQGPVTRGARHQHNPLWFCSPRLPAFKEYA